LLRHGLDQLARHEAVLGLAPDGGYWSIGLRTAHDEVFRGVPMSVATTGAAQLARLREQGLHVGPLPMLGDVDTIDDARAAAVRCLPGSAFAAALATTERGQLQRRAA